MMTMLRKIFLVVLVAYNVNCQDQNTYFVNTATLDNNNNVNLSWNYTAVDITFKVVANTNGWVGFGLSPNGGMKNSDIMLTWTDSNGNVQFQDAHVENQFNVIYDTVQNWEKLFYSNSNGATTVIFKRLIKICDQSEPNLDVLPTSYVIYAWGTGTPSYHGGNRGSRFLPLLATLNNKVTLNMNEITTYDYRVDSSLPNDRTTTYYCQMFQLPTKILATKSHVVRMETIVSPENLQYVHHWLMYECDSRMDEFLVNNSMPAPGICADGTNPVWNTPGRYCEKISLAWATGGDLIQDFPKNFGYPLGGSESKSKYFYLQIHYENPNKNQNVREDSGMRIYVTENLKPTEFGVFTMGTASTPEGIVLPPKMKKLSYEFQCRKDTLKGLFENGDIKVFAQIPHTHLAGVQVFSSVVRNNKETDFISNNKYYDSEFQYVNYLQKEVTLTSGDAISLTCAYNTEDRTETTFGGLGTYDEMCLNFIWYYPYNAKIDACYDFINGATWYGWFKSLNDSGQIDWQLSDPINFTNYYEDSLNSVEQSSMTSEAIEASLQSFINTAKRVSYTSGTNQVFKQNEDLLNIERLDESCTAPSTASPTPVIDPTYRPSTVTSFPITGIYDENTPFANRTPLGSGILQWNVTSTDIIFKVQTTATGWLGFGISPDGNMGSSDMALVWQRNGGSVEFRDAHSWGHLVFPDYVQNWKKLFYSQKDGLQTVIFSRKLVVPKQRHIPNIDINPGLTNIIYASGNYYLFGFPTYHGPTKGSQAVRLV